MMKLFLVSLLALGSISAFGMSEQEKRIFLLKAGVELALKSSTQINDIPMDSVVEVKKLRSKNVSVEIHVYDCYETLIFSDDGEKLLKHLSECD